MKISEIVERAQGLANDIEPSEFPYDLLSVYGLPKASITRLKSGSYNLSKVEGEILWKKKLFFKNCDSALHTAIDDARREERVLKQAPRFLLVTDFETLLAYDTKTEETLDIPIEKISEHYTFFLPWVGMEKALHQVENPADVKAAEKMARLYELIDADNPDFDRHALNVFLTRLLFCFFAEDTGIFENDAFTHSINNFTMEDGSDLKEHLEMLFAMLNDQNRAAYPIHLRDFPYANGGLFVEELEIPRFSAKSRRGIIESGDLGWSGINPDIFGSMFQAVTDSEKRGKLGIHYTSVPNIMKVIEPLFLDDLKEEFEKAKGNEKKLNRLLGRICRLQIFDPACGSGNFLIVAYKELRRLEMEIFEEISEVSRQGETMLSGIHVNQFYGIEIDEFAREIAILSLWLVAHQMNVESLQVLGSAPASLPLEDSANIVCGNATRIDWEEVCPKKKYGDIYILGNPPYKGAKEQTSYQKEDRDIVWNGENGIKKLDYVCNWFRLASSYLRNSSNVEAAFVATNSITQGEQPPILWERLYADSVEILFGHQTFEWSNSAINKAHVHVVIIGLSSSFKTKAKTILWEDKEKKCHKRCVRNITPYLTEGSNLFISARTNHIQDRAPKFCKGSEATDFGFLTLNKSEKEHLLQQLPRSRTFIRRFTGGKEYINGLEKWCLWLDSAPSDILSHPEIENRLKQIRKKRSESPKKRTRDLASASHLFGEIRQPTNDYLLIPKVSSHARKYIPIGYIDENIIVSGSAIVSQDADLFHFSILVSNMHMAWMRAICGRTKSDYQYSVSVVYNNFPFPELTNSRVHQLRQLAYEIIAAREQNSEKTLAQLYDIKKMPEVLLAAHQKLDAVVEKCYRTKPFTSDEERLEHLFKLYEEMTESELCLI